MLKDAGPPSVRHPDGLVDRPIRPQRPPRGECPGGTRCCRYPLVLRPAGHRQRHADGARHDPDGVRVWRTGKIDAPEQSTRRPGSCRQQGKKLGRPKVSPKVENAIRKHLRAGNGILKVAAMVGVGSGTVQRVKREMAEQLAEAA